MKAMAFKNFSPTPIEEMEFPVPQPKPQEVQIKVAYAGVNPVDWKIWEGLLKDRLPFSLPIIPGWDVSGTVSAVGSEVKHLKVGDVVMAYCRKPTIQWGTYAEYVTFIGNHVVKKPEKVAVSQAAAIPLASLTAWQAIVDAAHLKKGQKILIQAGAGGVGSYAIQIAKSLGAEVITTAREENHPYLKKLGADAVIDYTKENVVKKVKEWAPQGVDAVLESLGGKAIEESLQVLKPGGFLATILQQVDPKAAAQAEIYYGYIFVRPDGGQLENIAKLIDTGKIQVPEIQEFNWRDVKKAHQESMSGHVKGKIVLKVS